MGTFFYTGRLCPSSVVRITGPSSIGRQTMDVLAMFVLPAIAGVAIGILSGLLGIGGGTVMVPIFRLAFGMSPVVSTATSLFAIIPTSISGAASHIRHKTCIVSLGVAAGLGGALTSPLGVWLAQISPAWMIMVAAALIIGWSAVKMLGKAFKMRSQNRTQQHAASNDDAIDDRSRRRSSRWRACPRSHRPRWWRRARWIAAFGAMNAAFSTSGNIPLNSTSMPVPFLRVRRPVSRRNPPPRIASSMRFREGDVV